MSAIMLAMIAGLAAAQELQIPELYSGSVQIVGPEGTTISAPVGTVVAAFFGGNDMGSFTVTQEGTYGYLIAPKYAGDYIPDGSTVEFRVNGVTANETDTFRSGDVTELNLTVNDSVLPASSVNAISPPVCTSTTFSVTVSASDVLSGVGSVELYYRYSGGAWTSFGVDAAAPWEWSFTAPSGDGYYEFYSIARDRVGNVEAAPDAADASCTVAVSSLAAAIDIPSMTPETPAIVDVENVEDVSITELEINVLNAVENVRITVQEFTDKPAEIAIGAPGATYKYLEIVTENLSEDDISSVTIKFKIEKSWISSNSIDENTITLNRWNEDDNTWTSYPTIIVGEDDTYFYFSATLPGFSTFAITGRVIVVPPVTPPGMATLTVDTTPVKASVYVDGIPWGTAPQSRSVDPGTYTVSFGGVSGYTTPAPETVTLAADETRTVTGVYTEIPPTPAEFELNNLVIGPAEVGIGEVVTISVGVANVGGTAGTCSVTLTIDEIAVETRDITLAGGATGTVAFTVSRDAEGTYSVEVDGLTGSFTVVAPPPTPPGIPWIAVSGVIVIAALLATLFYFRRIR